MDNNSASKGQKQDQSPNNQSSALPSISLPKGGGAIRGIGEKFAANPVTGTGSMSVPIATSPGRSGFGPQLSLSYDSGAGNGPFGFGWNLSLPSITRKTDKGLPQYRDDEESDVFILSGAEDLVPMLEEDNGAWQREVLPPRTIGGKTYHIQRYRPRLEGLFARIERWTNQSDPEDVCWRSISRNNITTWYGKTGESRIADPGNPTRIFSWLICQSYDDKGNAIVYEYLEENSDRIFEDEQGNQVSLVHERNREDETRKANRYLKCIKYGNRTPNRDPNWWSATDPTLLADTDWMFEVVFDYGEGHYSEDTNQPPPDQHEYIQATLTLAPTQSWPVRRDPFSSCRAGFEVRTYRLCRRVLMFHHFPDELGTNDYLVRSTAFAYKERPFASFITSVTQSGYVHKPTQSLQNRYLTKSLPSLEFEYSQPTIHEEILEIEPESLENLPYGLDGNQYRFVDLDGEGVSGILTEQADVWFYKPNLGDGRFGPLETVAQRPSMANLNGGRQQLLDLAGDGQLDLAILQAPTPGFFERTHDESWSTFRTFTSLPNIDWNDTNLRLVDLTGDGHADVLVTEDHGFTWHLSLAEEGFDRAERTHQVLDEEKGPRLVFADGTQSIYLADLSGDGLTDLARVRNGEVCYWPSLGYGCFGAKVTMDEPPWFDAPDQFDQRRVRLADIDGSGTTDIIYLGRDNVRLYFNQSGNGWSAPQHLEQFPPIDNLSSVMAVDLLGNGTACLVWSSPLPGDATRPMRYIDLMGGGKPHLLIRSDNNLGAETQVHYAPSTKFYLNDKEEGKPWITKLPFPVHAVERIETHDHVSRNRFVTRYAYHHGYFDGEEREFRGFGMVEQRDTEEFKVLAGNGNTQIPSNEDEAFHVPPVLTKTWFHTGAFIGRARISKQFEQEYYREGDPSLGEGALSEDQIQAVLLPDTELPEDLPLEEIREACRALKGSLLRQEIYALDRSPEGLLTEESDRPYSVSERCYAIKRLQPRGHNRHAVFYSHPRETVDFHYERKLVEIAGVKRADPRVSHSMTLRVDNYGNVERSIAIGYRRRPVPDLKSPEQEETHITFTVDRFANYADEADWYRVGLPVETRSFELAKPPEHTETAGLVDLFLFQKIDDLVEQLFPSGQIEPPAASTWPYEKWDWRRNPANASPDTRLRMIEHVRTLYRPDDLGRSQNDDPLALLPLGTVQRLALPGESYKLALTASLAKAVFVDSGKLAQAELDTVLTDEGGYVHSEGDSNWWIPSGRIFYSTGSNDDASTEWAEAKAHLYLPRRYRDPFHKLDGTWDTETFVYYDPHELLVRETRDALDNRITVGERHYVLPDDTEMPWKDGNNYRVLQPSLIMDPNRNRSEVVFDALGMVAGTTVMGKPEDNPAKGDRLDAGFPADLTDAEISGFHDAEDPHETAVILLGDATTRIAYDLNCFYKTRLANQQDPDKWEPTFAATLARETHVSDPLPPWGLRIQIGFSYSDGFGREIQKKIQAEPEKNNDIAGPPRWVGSGWTIFNNKGKPVRQYEPFFSKRQRPDGSFYSDYRFEFGVKVGVSPVLFYDPTERVIATLHPNHTYEKVVFDTWQQTTYDVNDTCAPRNAQTGDPRTDPDIQGHVAAYFACLPTSLPAPAWQTWHAQRIGGALGQQEQAAATRAAAHADTPTTAHFDALGRPFMTVAHNRVVCADHQLDGTEDEFTTRIELDIEGNQREVKDERTNNGGILEERIVMRYDYDMLGNRIHQASMEAGERWTLNNAVGNPIRTWNSRRHDLKNCYDALQRPTLRILWPESSEEVLVERIFYGETHPDADRNLRGQLYQHFDGAGLVVNQRFDFKGNLLESRRQLTGNQRYQRTMNWAPLKVLSDIQAIATAAAPLLDPNDNFASRTKYDALNRPIQTITPHSNSMQPNVIQPGYNEANLLEKVDVWLGQTNLPNQLLDPTTATFRPVTNIDYNARGQRECVKYGNDTTTTYVYDPETFRLSSITTIRATDSNDLAAQLFVSPTTVQDLHYTYDPVGNITNISDGALLDATYNNQAVQPVSDYNYDAVYRLVRAQGREHIGQTAFDFAPLEDNYDYRDYPFIGLRPSANDPKAMRTYTEEYYYDEVGNIHRMRHTAAGGDWTRFYHYLEPSLLEPGDTIDPGKTNNRLTYTQVGNGVSSTESYGYTDVQGNDVQGCKTSINTMLMTWDFEDQLQVVDLGGGGTAYYVYDASGQRVRKVIERQNGTRQKERIYLGGFEIYREYNGATEAENLERETLHIMDSEQRIVLVETRTKGSDPAPAQVFRYQLGNHLGSASLELDGSGQVISYEEYTPYGSSTYQAVRSKTETSKRYRYTGKERDEESGLYYHGARYYAPWLGRWTSPDPAGLVDGVSLFTYVRGNPVLRIDDEGRASMTDEEVKAHMAREMAKVHKHMEPYREQGRNLVLGFWSAYAAVFVTAVIAYVAAPTLIALGSETPAAIAASPVLAESALDVASTTVSAAEFVSNPSPEGWTNVELGLIDLASGAPAPLAEAGAVNAVRRASNPATSTAGGSEPPMGISTRLARQGSWTGEPGNSEFIPANPSKLPHPDDPEVVDVKTGEGIPHKLGKADLGRWAWDEFHVAGLEGTKKDLNKTIPLAVAKRYGLLGKRGRPTAAEGRKYIRRLGLVPHHAEGDMVQLIPHGVHGSAAGRVGVPHLGEASEQRKRHGGDR